MKIAGGLPCFFLPVGIVGIFRSSKYVQLTEQLRHIIFRETQIERLTRWLRSTKKREDDGPHGNGERSSDR